MIAADPEPGSHGTGARTWLTRAGLVVVVALSAVVTAVIVSVAIDLVARLL